MDTVWIKHPKLPDSPPVERPASALAGLQRAGWEQTDAPPPPPLPEPDTGPDAPPKTEQPTNEAPAGAGASALPETSPRGRRASSNKESD